MQGLMAQLTQTAEPEEVGGNAWRELCGVRRLQWEKFLKTKLEDAVKLFNEDYRKGFQMMQVRPLSVPAQAESQLAGGRRAAHHGCQTP
jgi:hypothetical protein